MTAAFNTSIKAIEAYVCSIFGQSSVPGAAVAIFQRGERWSKGFGVTHVDQPRPVTPETIFQIASATKCFTTLALFRLCDEGMLDLDRPIVEYLRAFALRDAAHAHAITLRHVLRHRSGLEGDFCVDTGEGTDALRRAVERLVEAELVHAPGAMFSYCNAGFYLAGRVIELLTGLSYESAIDQLILKPLRLARSFFSANDVITRQFAVGHTIDADGVKPVHRWSPPRAANPIVGLASSVDDVLEFAALHLGTGNGNRGELVLSRPGLRQLLSPSTDAATGLAHTHTWSADASSAGIVLSAGGNMPQQVSRLALVPEKDFALVVLANSTAGGVLAETIQRQALQEFCGVEAEGAARAPASDELKRQACGKFVNPTSDMVIEEHDGSLFAQVMMKRGGFPYETVQQLVEWPRVPIALYASGRFAMLPETKLERWGRIVQSHGDTIDHVLVHGRSHRRA